MKNFHRFYSAVLLAGVATAALSTPAFADARDDKIKALEQKLDSLVNELKAVKQDQSAAKAEEKTDKDTLTNQVIDLKRGQAAQLTDAIAQKAAEPGFTFANGRPTWTSADGSSSIAVRSLLQYDISQFAQNGRSASGTDLSSGTNFRRARLGVDGKVLNNWSYGFLYDLGGSGTEGAKVSDAFVQYDGLGFVRFKTGAFATPQGIEDQTSAGDLLFLERAAPTDMARSIAGSDGRKNVLSIFGYGDDYYAAVTLSAAKAADPVVFDAQQAVVGRASYRVYKDADTNLIVSASGNYVFKIADVGAGPASTSTITISEGPENTVDGTKLVTSGAINARKTTTWGIETAGNWQSLYAQGGYFGYSIQRRASTLPDPDFNGWYAQGSWILTGEKRPYNVATAAFGSPRPTSPFDFKGSGIGAWELTARYSVVDLNFRPGAAGAALVASTGGIRGGRQEGITAGINWYPNSVIRFILDYQHLDIYRLASVAPFQNIGQKVDIATARAQLAF